MTEKQAEWTVESYYVRLLIAIRTRKQEVLQFPEARS